MVSAPDTHCRGHCPGSVRRWQARQAADPSIAASVGMMSAVSTASSRADGERPFARMRSARAGHNPRGCRALPRTSFVSTIGMMCGFSITTMSPDRSGSNDARAFCKSVQPVGLAGGREQSSQSAPANRPRRPEVWASIVGECCSQHTRAICAYCTLVDVHVAAEITDQHRAGEAELSGRSACPWPWRLARGRPGPHRLRPRALRRSGRSRPP